MKMSGFLKRSLVMLLSVALISNSTDMTVFAMSAEPEEVSSEQIVVANALSDYIGTVDGVEEVLQVENMHAGSNAEDEVIFLDDIWMDLGDTYTTAPSKKSFNISVFSLENGTVELIDGTAVDWIDRIDLTGDAAVIRTFYDSLVEASDNDGLNDYFIGDSYFANSECTIPVAQVTGTVASSNEISTKMSEILTKYSPYVRAAYDAFDRDHPEVFWLSGDTSCGISGSYSGKEGGYTYTFNITFLVKGNTSSGPFDIRDTGYQSQSAIKTAIAARDSKVNDWVNAVEGLSTAKKLDYFNDQLTTINQYNTSSNLNNIGHDCRECVSALEGRIGTEGPVCEAYARAFKVLCDKAGIPCVLVDGEARNSLSSAGEGHMWNYVQVDNKWYGMDVTWNDPTVSGSTGAVSGHEGDNWSLVGSETVVGNGGMKFIESHPVSNTVSSRGIAFTNGPVIEEDKYVETSPYGTEVTSGTCGQDGSVVRWTVYDSGEDNSTSVTTSDTLVISGSGAMADYENNSERPWDSYTSSIVNVVVEDGITAIGSISFRGMAKVTSIRIPDDITSIGNYAFAGMIRAEGLKIPSTVTYIGEGAFSACYKLTDVEIPAGVTQLRQLTFGECTGLTNITIPANIISIEEATFWQSTNLTTVYIAKRENPVEGVMGFTDSETPELTLNATVYFESTPITEFEGMTLKYPYSIAYSKDGITTTFAEVYADNNQSYTIKEGDLPENSGIWYISDYNGGGRKEITVGTVLENISSDVLVELIPVKTDISEATVNVLGTYSYDGTEKIPATDDVTVTLNGKRISSDNYEITSLTNNINAGTATVTVTAKENSNYTGEASGTFTISPMEIEIADAEFATKIYDGTSDAIMTSVSFTKVETDETINLVKDVDYSVSAFYNDANAGTDKVISATLTLTNVAATNYVLNSGEILLIDQVIRQASAPTAETVTKKYVYSKSYEVSMNLDNLLPDLEDDVSFGDLSYRASMTSGDVLDGDPIVDGSTLTYTVKAGEAGETGVLTVTVNSQNYQTFTIIVNLQLIDLLPVAEQESAEVSLEDNTLTYGEALSKLIFSDAVFVEEGTDIVVEGTLAWENADRILDVGTHSAKWIFTPKDEAYATLEGEVDVIVNPMDISDAIVNIAGIHTYNGVEQIPATDDVTVTLNGKRISSDNYEITSLTNNINAGTATVTVTAKENSNYTGEASGTFTISPMEIEIADAEFATKIYDGTSDAIMTSVSFTKVETDETINLVKDTDYTAEGFYNAVNASEDATITVMVSLTGTAASNYEMAVVEKIFENQTISKATAPVVDLISKEYISTRNQEDALHLNELLPTLSKGCTYGEMTYTLGEVTTDFFEVEPSINDTMLSYTVKEGTAGDAGNIVVYVTTQNYEEIELTINLTLIDKMKVELQNGSKVSLEHNILSYGEALSELIFNKAVFVEEGTDIVVEGTLAWENPEQVLKVGTHNVKWIFTPSSDDYTALEGEIEVIVEKADCEINMSGTSDGYDVSYIYDGEHIPAPTVEQFSYSSEEEGAAVIFSWYRGDYVNGNMPLTAQNKLSDTPIDAGVYTLVLAIEATESYNVAEGRILVEIAKKKVTVAADHQERKYKEKNPVLTYVVPEGTLVGDDKVEDLKIVLSTEADVDSVVGTYPITGTATSNNYDVTITPATLTIVQADASIIVSEEKKTYKKTFGDLPFTIEATTNSDGVITYIVKDGKTLEGEPKAESDILTVSADGIATVNGSGTVTVQLNVNETSNYKSADPVTVSVRIERYDGFIVEPISDEVYIGKAICPEPKVYDGESETLLEKGKDYTVAYKNNINASTEVMDSTKLPTVIVKGKGSYTKQIVINFNILQKDIGDEDVAAPDMYLLTNGSVQKKVPTLTYNKKKLKVNKDMKVSYPDTGAGAYQADGEYTIHVKGQGNYTGERDVAITLKDKGYLINKVGIKRIPAQNYADYNGEVILDSETLVVTSKINGENVILEEGIDFETEYENNDKAGTATVTIIGINDFSGVKKATFKINGISIAKATVEGITDQIYNGQVWKPEVTVTLPTGEKLIPDEDYTVDYPEKATVGTATVTIKGTGAYSGIIKKKFKINPYDFTGETNANGHVKDDTLLTEANGLLGMADGELHVKFVKGGSKPEVELYFDGTALIHGKDYTVSYMNNKAVTTAETTKLPMITIKGKGNFKGTITKIFTIDAKDLDDGVHFTVNDKAATGKAGGYISKPVLTDEDGKKLVAGKDYTNPIYTLDEVTLDKTSIVEVGKVITVTVRGVGNYTDKEITATYRITEKDFTAVKVAAITKIYNGREMELTESDFYKEDGTSKVMLKDGTELKYGVDFEIVEESYKKNDKKGTATVNIRGLGQYGGAKTIKFKIVSKELKR